MLVKLYHKAVRGLYGSDFYIGFLYVASFQIGDIGVSKPGIAAEQQHIPRAFKILFCRWKLKSRYSLQFLLREEDYLF